MNRGSGLLDPVIDVMFSIKLRQRLEQINGSAVAPEETENVIPAEVDHRA